ncbi:MAG TPA: DUF362 domain-containing protein [Opitutaceae bacterium]|jgi:uncharacterized protein (DUF362 family)|nr:DUF362 domain-containing protein [Opitutaceae bacterium]
MKSRRDFIKTGLALGATFSLANRAGLFAADGAPSRETDPRTAPPAAKPVLVAVRDGSRVAMLDQALAALGGIGTFVKQGQTVLVKPNIGWDAAPERGANTHPDLVGHLIKLCLEAGAKSVSVFDNPCDQWQRTYANSGIERAAKDAGGIVVNGKDQSFYREVAIPGGIKLKHARVHALVLDSDVFFNVPVLKHHSGALMTAAMKNLMGVIWDRGDYHRNDLHQTIADFLTFKQPTLNVLDAYHPMVRNGPRGTSVEDVVEMRTLLASTDIVAIDAAGAKMLGHQPSDVRHVRIGDQMKLGTMNLDQVEIRRFKLA